MTFCLCQRFNVKKKNGNQFFELNNGEGFKFSWTYSSYLLFLDYKMEMSEINEKFQLDSVQLKTDKTTYDVDPKKVTILTICKGESKFVNLKVVWCFKNAPGTKPISETTTPSTTKKSTEVFNLCQRLTLHRKRNDFFVKLNNELGFTFHWEKHGKIYRKKKHNAQLYYLKVSELNNELQYEDIKLKYGSSTYTLSPGIITAVEMLDDTPRLIELNVKWSYKIEHGEAKTDCEKTFVSTIVDLKKVLQEQMEVSADQQKKNESEDKYVFQYIPSTPSTEILPKITTLEENEAPKIHEAIDIDSDPSKITLPLIDVFTSQKYSDVIFHTNDSKKVVAHRCILFLFSDIFTALFDQSSNIPVEIEVDYSEAVVTRGIEFCYGKSDGIQNFEEDLIRFADKYGVKGLKKVCLKSLKDQRLTTENVCKIAEIAFEQNYTLLKQKCLQFILQKKNELGEENLSKLPTEILVSTILSL